MELSLSEPQPSCHHTAEGIFGSVSVHHYARKVPLEDRNKLEAWGFIVKCLPEVGSMGTRHSPIYYSLGCE